MKGRPADLSWSRKLSMTENAEALTPISPAAFINRELSWLRFAGRVLELARDAEVPLLERVKYAGILGMLHDEFFMKRVAGLKRQINEGVNKSSLDGRTPAEELAACRKEILRQGRTPTTSLANSYSRHWLRPASVSSSGMILTRTTKQISRHTSNGRSCRF